MSERLQTTIKHFKDGVTSISLTAARHSIEAWQTELKGYEGKQFETIAADLGHLHDELGSQEIDGKKVGKLLAKLGKETTKIAKSAEDKNDLVTQLGEELEKAGADLDKETANA